MLRGRERGRPLLGKPSRSSVEKGHDLVVTRVPRRDGKPVKNLYLMACPVCQDGLLRPFVIAGGLLILFCDEQDHTWFHPADVSVDAYFDPGSPRTQTAEGMLLAPPVRLATFDDLPASWRTFDWYDY